MDDTPKPEWQTIAEAMLDTHDLGVEEPETFRRLRELDHLVKKAKPCGGLRSSQVVALVVQAVAQEERTDF